MQKNEAWKYQECAEETSSTGVENCREPGSNGKPREMLLIYGVAAIREVRLQLRIGQYPEQSVVQLIRLSFRNKNHAGI